MVALTPRWVLDTFNSNQQKAETIRNRIRERLEAYDDIAPHPQLKQYGSSENHEWKQYFLRDEDSELSQCPFHHQNPD